MLYNRSYIKMYITTYDVQCYTIYIKHILIRNCNMKKIANSIANMPCKLLCFWTRRATFIASNHKLILFVWKDFTSPSWLNYHFKYRNMSFRGYTSCILYIIYTIRNLIGCKKICVLDSKVILYKFSFKLLYSMLICTETYFLS